MVETIREEVPDVTAELGTLTSALYEFMLASEAVASVRMPDSPVEALCQRAAALATRCHAACAAAPERAAATLSEASRNLRALAAELASHRPQPEQVRALWDALGANYEALFAYVRDRRVPIAPAAAGHLKPRNYARNVFHVFCGMFGVFLYEVLQARGPMIAVGSTLLAAFVALDLGRRYSRAFNDRLIGTVFARIVRPHEAHQIPSATWYLAALVVGVTFMPKEAIQVGAIVLALGDPAASLAGKRWGRIKLWRQKSLTGSLAFTATAALATFGFLTAFTSLAPPTVLAISGASAVVGAVTELFSHRVDDNFTIPLAAGLTAMLLL